MTAVSGARNRRAGHQAERDLVAYLQRSGFPDAATTRSRLGHDGFAQRGDVDGVPDTVIEVKNRRELRVGEWLVDVCDAASETGDLPVLVVKPRGVADPAGWWAVLPCDELFALIYEIAKGNES